MRALGQLSRRRFASGLALLPGFALARDSALPVPASLADAGRAATAQGEPLVILVTLPGCPYCELVRRNYLLPLRAGGLQAWQIDISQRQARVRDFAGSLQSGAQLAASWKVRLTPTVLFFNASGVELVGRLAGVAVADFFGAYLDQSLAEARKKLSAAA